MAHFIRRHCLLSVWMCAIVALWVPAFAVTLTWEGDVGTGWFDDVSGDTNWSGDALPAAGYDLVFTSAGTYAGDLTLGGQTIALNSITVGSPGDTAAGGPSDFGVSYRNLGTNGTIQLGAGGLTSHMAYGATSYNGAGATVRNIRFNTDFELSVDTFFKTTLPAAPYNTRRLYLGGEIRGGTTANPIDLVMSTPNGSSGTNMSIWHYNGMPDFVGTLSLSGTQIFDDSSAIWGDPSNVVKISTSGTTNGYIFKYYGDVTVPNDVIFDPSILVRLYCLGSSSAWEFAGDITGGSTQLLDLLGSPNSRFIFSGDVQTFTNRPWVRSGTGVIIAGADASGVAWPNAGYIRMNFSRLTSGTSALLLRGDYTLNQLVQVGNLTFTTYTVPVEIGQVNDGANAFDAVFNGRIDTQEPDFQVLRLTADAGGSATFNGEINVNGGGYGFDKIGAGTVVLGGRVSEDLGNTTPINTVNVQEGTLLVNNSFYTTGIVVDDGATLGGSGNIFGNVTLSGTAAATLAPGASVGTLTVDGNVDFDAAGVLSVDVDSAMADLLDVSGALDLSAGDDTLVVDSVLGAPRPIYIIARYGSLNGVFDTVDLSALVYPYEVIYNFNGLNEIALVAPEPSSVMLLLVGALAMFWWRRKRSK